MMMGGLRSFELMEEAVQRNESAMVSMSRPFVREPDLIKRWESGDRQKAACISCNACLGVVRRGEGLKCAADNEIKAG
jgi:2,4-dienoyl-CoA reductase-like NADH-dependent reductase (Old Yellow Enzyme family)